MLTIPQAFELGLEDYGSGRIAEAERLLRDILAVAPDHAASLHLMGVMAHRLGRQDEALAWVAQAVGADLGEAAYHNTMGVVLKAMGRPGEAMTTHLRALALSPGYLAALNNLGSVLEGLGRAAEAEICCRRATRLAPVETDAWNNLGAILLRLGRPAEAAEAWERIVAVHPDFADGHNNLACALLEINRVAEADRHCRAAVALRPDYADGHYNLAKALQQAGDRAGAITFYRRATLVNADYLAAFNNLGNCQRELGAVEAGGDSLRAAICVAPARPEPYNNLANVHYDLGEFERSVALGERALAIDPDYRHALHNLGAGLMALHRLDDAIGLFRRSLALAPDSADSQYNLALAQLMNGDLANGFEKYEWRWLRSGMSQVARREPLWTGYPPHGRTIALWAEQGHGDTLHFVRYAPLVAARGARVVLEVQPGLVRLLQGMPGVAAVLSNEGELPRADAHCPFLTLPLLFGTTLATIPAGPPYLFAHPALIARWGARLGARRRPRIGLVWAGDPRPNLPEASAIDRRRSLGLAALAPLARVTGADFVSLQKGHGAAEAANPPPGMRLIDPMAEVGDFADTAALIAHLDLVVTVDTSVAHLAGAMGKPVWVLSRYDSCWRWLLDCDHSPWYPTLRLFRQPRPGHWPEVIAAVAEALAGFVAEG